MACMTDGGPQRSGEEPPGQYCAVALAMKHGPGRAVAR
jgi:hypothetical protein